MTNQVMALSLQDIIIGITTLSCLLLNYLILIGKNIYLGLQKDACASEYRKFQTKSENLLSNRNKHCLKK